MLEKEKAKELAKQQANTLHSNELMMTLKLMLD